jgi:hypothetical protein
MESGDSSKCDPETLCFQAYHLICSITNYQVYPLPINTQNYQLKTDASQELVKSQRFRGMHTRPRWTYNVVVFLCMLLKT